MNHAAEHDADTSEPGAAARRSTSKAGDDELYGSDHIAHVTAEAVRAEDRAGLLDQSDETHIEDTEEGAGDAEASTHTAAQGDAESVPSTKGTFGGLSASEAASLRWAKHRARQAAQAAVPELDDAADLIVRVPIARRAILTELESKARKGDTGASRELRAWLQELPIEDETDVSTLDRRTRQSLMAELLCIVEEEGDDWIETALRHIAAAIAACERGILEGHPRDRDSGD